MLSVFLQLKTILSSKILFSICSMLFFWALFDGMVSYITPIAIKDAGFSNTMLGIILGFSSLAGAIFDFLLSKYLTNTHFRRIYLFMFLVCALYPVLLINTSSIGIFLVAMAVWGLYYDLNNFGSLDFVSRKFKENTSSLSFFMMQTYSSLGYMIFYFVFAAGISISLNWNTVMALYLVLGISFLSYLMLIYFNRKEKNDLIPDNFSKPLSFFFEAKLWLKINKLLFPLIFLTLMFNIFDGFFWTLGPLLAENMKDLQDLSGITPQLLSGNMDSNAMLDLTYKINSMYPIGENAINISFTLFLAAFCIFIFFRNKLGKLLSAYAFFYLGSLMLAFLIFAVSKFEVLFFMMSAFALFGIALPWLDSAYTDHIKKTSEIEKEIQAIRDFFVNIGFVVGPVASGILADNFGYINAFSYLGWFYLLIVLLALFTQFKSTK